MPDMFAFAVQLHTATTSFRQGKRCLMVISSFTKGPVCNGIDPRKQLESVAQLEISFNCKQILAAFIKFVHTSAVIGNH